MEIEQIEDKKRILKNKINQLIEDFKKETGIPIGVKVSFIEFKDVKFEPYDDLDKDD